jgi:GAF domain-containing protein/multidrug resistance efflux pump
MENSSALVQLASVLFACRDHSTLRRTFVARVGAAIGARAVTLWLADAEEGQLVSSARWAEADEKIAPTNERVSDGILTTALEDAPVFRASGKELDGDSFTHFPAAQRPAIQSALLVAYPATAGAAGVVEALNKKGGFTADDAEFVGTAARLASQADAFLSELDVERDNQLTTIERLTSLYDISRIFNSTVELTELTPIVTGKIRDILHAQACNLWLVSGKGDTLQLVQQDGEDPSVEDGATTSLDSGHLAEAAKTGNPRLIENIAEEESLAERVAAAGEFEIQSIICAPLRKEQHVIGVIELINKEDGTPFTEEDVFFLSSVSEQAAVALNNANLLESERKLHELDALMKISQAITSTLDLDHVLTTVAQQAGTIVPFDRCVIGFFDRNKFVLGAVSGEEEVPKTDEMGALRKGLEWVSTQEGAVSADKGEEGWKTDPESAGDVLSGFLDEHGYGGLYALPLRDDQGTVGVLCLLNGEPEFLNDNQRETVTILANQTTVAIRNAQLYQQVPLAGFLKPLAKKRLEFFGAGAQSRWFEYGWKAALAALVLTIVPWPVRVSTNATVVPADRRVVSAIADGIVKRVFVHEGDVVTQNQVLAQLDDGEDRVKLDRARSDFSIAQHDLAEAEFRRDLTAESQARLRAGAAQAEVRLEEQRVAGAQLRAPIDGVVVTPKIEEKTGAMLREGQAFCEIVEQQRMAVNMNVSETDLNLVRAGKSVALKLNAFPTDTFTGTVDRVGVRSEALEGEEFFVIRAVFDNADFKARDGMAGRARIRAGGGWFGTGWYPIGYALLRSPARWFWEKVWDWLP